MASKGSLRMILTNSQREVCSLENSAGNSYLLRKGHGSLTHTNAAHLRRWNDNLKNPPKRPESSPKH